MRRIKAKRANASICINMHELQHDVCTVDLFDEAQYRVYFGFFDMSLLRKDDEEDMQAYASSRQRRAAESIADGSMETASERRRKPRTNTNTSDFDGSSHFVHTCSLYHHPSYDNADYEKRKTTIPNRAGCYKDIFRKKTAATSEIDENSEQLKVGTALLTPQHRLRKALHKKRELMRTNGKQPCTDRSIVPRYDQPRYFCKDGTVVYQDQYSYFA